MNLSELELSVVSKVVFAVESCSVERDELLDHFNDGEPTFVINHEDFVLSLTQKEVQALKRANKKL